MYSLADAISVKADWGHSSNIFGVELCQLANAAHLCLFHHEPASSDAVIAKVLQDTRRLEEITRTGRPLKISAAYDGLEIAL
jgi:ribonuclease BN (tRNA processing enzyme)